MDKISVVLLTIAIIALFFFWLKKYKSKTGSFERQLIGKCFGDHNKADRLISFELQKNPQLPRETAAKNAIQSLMRDNI